MPPRDSELPEGTDHIINGAMETGAGTGASTGSSATGGGTGSTGSFIGGATGGLGDDTGGSTLGGSATLDNDFKLDGGPAVGSNSGTRSSSGGATDKIAGQVREQVNSIKGQATDKIRQFADTGKDRATSALDNFNEVVQDAARSVDEKLGEQYGQYAHRAADAVSSLAEGLRGKSVEDLLEDSRAIVRKSPALAIGAAALIGFALARVVKAGMPDDGSETDVDFTPDRSLSTGTTPERLGTTTTTSTGV